MQELYLLCIKQGTLLYTVSGRDGNGGDITIFRLFYALDSHYLPTTDYI